MQSVVKQPGPSDLSDLMQAQMESIGGMTTAQLREELAKSLRITVEQLVRMAAIVRLLQDRGDELVDIRLSILNYLRKIAYGQILPELVVKFQSAPLLLNRASQLPLPDQKKLIGDAPVKLVIFENGRTDHRLLDPLKMNAVEIRQVFARDHIRDDAEQVSYLRSKPTPVHRHASEVVVDGKRKGIVVSGDNVFISRSDLVNYLSRVTD